MPEYDEQEALCEEWNAGYALSVFHTRALLYATSVSRSWCTFIQEKTFDRSSTASNEGIQDRRILIDLNKDTLHR